MKNISAIKADKKEIEELLKVITDNGKLTGNETETWEDYIGFIVDLEDLISNEIVLEKLAQHFSIDKIMCTDVNYDNDSVFLIYKQDEI